MPAHRETWLFKVEESDLGEISLSPERRTRMELHRGEPALTLLDSWNINFVLPKGTDVEDARRIADLLNEWIQGVSCVSRKLPPRAPSKSARRDSVH